MSKPTKRPRHQGIEALHAIVQGGAFDFDIGAKRAAERLLMYKAMQAPLRQLATSLSTTDLCGYFNAVVVAYHRSGQIPTQTPAEIARESATLRKSFERCLNDIRGCASAPAIIGSQTIIALETVLEDALKSLEPRQPDLVFGVAESFAKRAASNARQIFLSRQVTWLNLNVTAKRVSSPGNPFL